MMDLVGAVGGSVTFPLKNTGKQVDSIVWVFNITTLVTRQPFRKGKPATVIVTQNRNTERINFTDKDFLQLSKLQKNDSGVYRVQVYSSSSELPFTQEYMLRVYEHLSKPRVTVGLQNRENGTCMTNLTCSMEHGGEDVTYSWEGLGQAVNESHDGPILFISRRLGRTDMAFTCKARNPISSNFSSPILAWKLCEDDGSVSSMVFLQLLCLPILVIFFISILIHLRMRRERKEESTEGKEQMDIHQEVPHFCPSSGETTEYNTISYSNNMVPEEDSVNGLYSTVQIPKTMESPCSLPTIPGIPRPTTYENII
ncbi:SLAM family member 7 [Tupaia chinensis]|uniref:SLAM family member 7 n=2 Tax=Tupaia chinensis TaxID=246437 RepID=L8Y6H5_TUPCH|nr:SLAM family member 7 [Tupaia chinensis]